eukprot:2921676-Pyramimonas_sp.AAC.1
MAQVQDALWVARFADAIQEYCGPGQMGGIFDPISLTLGLSFQLQLRDKAGAATHLALGDQKCLRRGLVDHGRHLEDGHTTLTVAWFPFAIFHPWEWHCARPPFLCRSVRRTAHGATS